MFFFYFSYIPGMYVSWWKQKGSSGTARGSVIKQVPCMGCESSLNASSSPGSALSVRKALLKGQVQTGTPILSSYTFLLWRIDKYVKYVFHKLEENS